MPLKGFLMRAHLQNRSNLLKRNSHSYAVGCKKKQKIICSPVQFLVFKRCTFQ